MFKWLVFGLVLMWSFRARAQLVTECPKNIGFEFGSFTNWECYIGEITETDRNKPIGNGNEAIIQVSPSGPTPGRHELITGGNDPYGGFSLASPNGSKYVLKLGNNSGGHGAERVSYTLSVPTENETYSIVFNYAIVFQNPTHRPEEQPKFTVRVVDVSTQQVTECGSLEFVANEELTDQEFGKISTPQGDVLFKTWTPVLVDLTRYKGQQIRLEFTTNDCSHNAHFGYAYIDINENCTLPLLGNVSCAEAKSVTLSAITGFESYTWFYPETGEIIGGSSQVTITPAPPIGTKVSVTVVPYAGQGCSQTLSTVISRMVLNVHSPPESCLPVDLTTTAVTVGSSTELSYTYWRNAQATQALANPKRVTSSGTYYIKGTSISGCTQTLPVTVTILTLMPINPSDPHAVNYPATVDITSTYTPQAGLTYTYWRNAATNIPLSNPERVRFSGTYYIKGTTADGCTVVAPVIVDVRINGLIIPNTFTPNNDGYNDVFLILAASSFNVKLVSIFTRWGQKVYETPELTNYWDGTKDSKPMPVGVYYYIVEGEENKVFFRRSGWVSVIR